jgi:hypothetical protein
MWRGQLGALGQRDCPPEFTSGQRLPCPGFQHPRSQVELSGLAGELVSSAQVRFGCVVTVQVYQARGSQQRQPSAGNEQATMLAQSGAGVQETPGVSEVRPDAGEQVGGPRGRVGNSQVVDD